MSHVTRPKFTSFLVNSHMSQGTHLAKMTSYVHLLILVPIILEENRTCKPQNLLHLPEFALSVHLGCIGKCSLLKDHPGVPIFRTPPGWSHLTCDPSGFAKRKDESHVTGPSGMV